MTSPDPHRHTPHTLRTFWMGMFTVAQNDGDSVGSPSLPSPSPSAHSSVIRSDAVATALSTSSLPDLPFITPDKKKHPCRAVSSPPQVQAHKQAKKTTLWQKEYEQGLGMQRRPFRPGLLLPGGQQNSFPEYAGGHHHNLSEFRYPGRHKNYYLEYAGGHKNYY